MVEETAAEEAVHLAKGEKTNADAKISHGKINVPAIMLKPVVVTKDNIQDNGSQKRLPEFKKH